jgi:hypothetical protein
MDKIDLQIENNKYRDALLYISGYIKSDYPELEEKIKKFLKDKDWSEFVRF